MTSSSWVLYVGKGSSSSYNSGSAACMIVMDELGMWERTSLVAIQDVEVVRREAGGSLPDWLRTTPTLLHTGTREVFRGSSALGSLVRIGAGELMREAAAAAATEGTSSRRASTRRAAVDSDERDETGDNGWPVRGSSAQKQVRDEETMHDEDDGGGGDDVFASISGSERIGSDSKKVTESDLDQYIKARERALPTVSQEQQV